MATNGGPPPASERKRVKVYELKNNDWFDRGTGFCKGVVAVRLSRRHSMRAQDLGNRGGIRVHECHRLICATTERGSQDCSPIRRRPESRTPSNAHLQRRRLSETTGYARVVRWGKPPAKTCVDTLIVWTEQNGTDMALSFQEPEGCASIW
jgi:protein phosphatase-4 regulatory subunit 3